jgi:hypothetical protein
MINIFSRYKFIFYFFNFVIIFLYLFPGSFLGCFLYDNCLKQPQITPDFWISTNHLYAFSILSVVGFFTFNKIKQFKIISIYLILLSIILEFLHLVIPERSFQFSDLFGNLIGVVIVVIISFFLKKNEKY